MPATPGHSRQVRGGADSPVDSSVRKDKYAAGERPFSAVHSSKCDTEACFQLCVDGQTPPFTQHESIDAERQDDRSIANSFTGAILHQPQLETYAARRWQTEQLKPTSDAAKQIIPVEQTHGQPAEEGDTSLTAPCMPQRSGVLRALPGRLHKSDASSTMCVALGEAPQEHSEQGEVTDEAASACSSSESIARRCARTLQLSGQGWAMPVRLRDPVEEGIHLSASLLHEEALAPPKQAPSPQKLTPLPAIKADKQEFITDVASDSPGATSDISSLSEICNGSLCKAASHPPVSHGEGEFAGLCLEMSRMAQDI